MAQDALTNSTKNKKTALIIRSMNKPPHILICGISILARNFDILSSMNFTVHSLELHRPITAPAGDVSPDGTESLREYRTGVQKNDLEPAMEDHLREGSDATVISPGYYLFVQGIMPRNESEAETLWRQAAEALWHESLWRETIFKDDRILIRILSEDGKKVFQLFRRIE